jgi:hypothetical protein
VSFTFNPLTGKFDIDTRVKIINGADNVIVRFDGTDAIQGYTSNAPTITDDGIASFSDNGFLQNIRIGAGSSVTGNRGSSYGVNSNAAFQGTAAGYNSEAGPNAFAGGASSRATNAGAALAAEAVVTGTYGWGGAYRASVAHTASVALGGLQPTTTIDRQMVVGGVNTVITQYYWGGNVNGVSAGAITRNFQFYFTPVAGTNVSHTRDFELNAPAGTGTGSCGSLKFRVALPGSTGSTTNTHTDALEITPEGEAVHSFAVRKPITTISTNTTLNSTHYTVLVDTTAGNVTVTLPTNVDGRIYNIKKISSDSNKAIISGTVDGGASTQLTVPYESLTIQNETTNWWII